MTPDRIQELAERRDDLIDKTAQAIIDSALHGADRYMGCVTYTADRRAEQLWNVDAALVRLDVDDDPLNDHGGPLPEHPGEWCGCDQEEADTDHEDPGTTIDIEPNWDGMRRFVERVYQSDPTLARRLAVELGSEAPELPPTNEEEGCGYCDTCGYGGEGSASCPHIKPAHDDHDQEDKQ